METSKEAFLAWLAVDPRYANREVGRQLVGELHRRLWQRDCTHVWLSWELVDGKTTQREMIDGLGKVVQVSDMPYYATTRSMARSYLMARRYFAPQTA